MRRKILLAGAVSAVIGVLLSTAVVFAGSLNPGSGPGDAGSQMFTLQQIYDRLDTGAGGSKMTAFTEPSSGPGSGTMRTLDEVMGKAPAVDAANGAVAADVANGKTFWGLTSGQWGLQTGTGSIGSTYNAGVPKTGQTTCYNPSGTVIACAGTGQDGDLQKGVAWPNPRFTDNLDGTVTDNLTGLIWLKNANCFGLRNWATADANGLASGTCGLTDGSTAGQWRLPNVREMQSLVHYGVFNPAVPNTAGTGKWTEGDPFTGVQSNFYWTSTTGAGSTPAAWIVNLFSGNVSSYAKAGPSYVWPVRGGQ